MPATRGSRRATSVLLVISLAVFGLALGAVRAFTAKLWSEGGRTLRQGTWLTIVLWLFSIGGHLALDAISALGSASLLLYLGTTLATQRLVLSWRVRREIG